MISTIGGYPFENSDLISFLIISAIVWHRFKASDLLNFLRSLDDLPASS
jgi:hypothetical protein